MINRFVIVLILVGGPVALPKGPSIYKNACAKFIMHRYAPLSLIVIISGHMTRNQSDALRSVL